jgi:PAS domain-containing protein
VPIFDAEGHWRGYRGIDRDITERKRNEEALLQALTHEREIDRLKNEFIATQHYLAIGKPLAMRVTQSS